MRERTEAERGKEEGRTLPSNSALTTCTVKCVSPFPPPDSRIGAWWRWAAESFEMARWVGVREAVSCAEQEDRQRCSL